MIYVRLVAEVLPAYCRSIFCLLPKYCLPALQVFPPVLPFGIMKHRIARTGHGIGGEERRTACRSIGFLLCGQLRSIRLGFNNK
ncbi:hypothetical protein HMPREF1981_02232 [Bacteroides pyogenes F0041]|uniref:Uncharacterized protein n=1 Tax=Bacteroides pyogenes F0041 TaxID=1321819 RepID=U2DY26_9BACE|nr:hypothetical protein HMPREF1981_02232 [Bacteroides pyogenes F0041]